MSNWRELGSVGIVIAVMSIAALVGLGCGADAGVSTTAKAVDPEDRAEIEAMLQAYLPKLAEAYSTGNIELIRPWAVERVMAQVEKRVVDLMEGGLSLDPELESVVIEELKTWGNDFALVTTFEVWNLRYYSVGGQALVSERVGNRSRVEYQLKVRDGTWTVFHRRLQQDLDDAAVEE